MGADVALVDIAQPDALKGVLDYPLASRADLAQSEATVRAEGVRTASAVADTRRFDQMQAAVAKASAALGDIDILVAVAGVDHGEDDLDHYSEAKYAAIVDTNLHGTLNTVRAALPQIERRQGGRIVMIASLAGRRGNEKISLLHRFEMGRDRADEGAGAGAWPQGDRRQLRGAERRRDRALREEHAGSGI